MRNVEIILTNDCRRICPVFVESGTYSPTSRWTNNKNREWSVLFSRDECMNIRLLINWYTVICDKEEYDILNHIVDGMKDMTTSHHHGTMLKAVMTDKEIMTLYKLYQNRRGSSLYASIGKEFMKMVDSVLEASVIHQGGE